MFLKAILEKKFQIKKGSNLQWNGDVMNPELDITAGYSAIVSNANEYLGMSSLPTLNVELQAKIVNKLTRPDVKPILWHPKFHLKLEMCWLQNSLQKRKGYCNLLLF